MKQFFTLKNANSLNFIVVAFSFLFITTASAQTTPVLGSPLTYIYGLTSNGEILEINSTTAATYRVIKNNSYSGNSPSKSNGLAYNATNGKFYYFKRNVNESPQEFVSFDPKTNTVTALASSTCADEVHTGCITYDGKGYYTIDTKGNVNYYNIVTNTWKTITSNIVDQYNNNVTSVIQSQSAGDIATDGYGNIWVLTSSNSNYGLYKIPYPAPTTAVAKLTVQRIIAPTAATPTGNSFAGIAFNATGQIFLGTRGDDRLYLLTSALTLQYIAKFSNSDAGNDLTSQNFPLDILPVKWLEFGAATDNSNNVTLNWRVMEYQNKGFYIQHSTDGSNWEDLGFVASRNIAESAQNYSYSYRERINAKHYYRIKQVDIDGKESFSEIRTINSKNTSVAISVWPNPATSSICIANNGTGENRYTKVMVIDLSGKVNTQKELQQGKNIIDVNMLATGTYFAKVYSSNGSTYTQKFIKQ